MMWCKLIMLAKIISCTMLGLEVAIFEVEADTSPGLPFIYKGSFP